MFLVKATHLTVSAHDFSACFLIAIKVKEKQKTNS